VIPAIGIGPLGKSEWSVGGLGTSVPSVTGASSATGASGTSGASFGDALTKAVGGLESTQATATTASEQLATGQLTDPTQAVTAVENASLAMDFASQMRNQIDAAATTIFQTQL
jgi:flagellar hook-basal body complex protein FliE